MTQDLKTYHDSLANLLQAGKFEYGTDLCTLTEDEYKQLLTQVEPQDYCLAYQMDNGLNILEKLSIERDDHNNVVAMTYERSWREVGLRVFEFEIVRPPKLIVIGAAEPDPGRVIRLTWWVLSTGDLAHYRAMIDDIVMFSEGILK